MKTNFFLKLLSTFDFASFSDLMQSVAPTQKYQLVAASVTLSSLLMVIAKWFGMDGVALVALMVIFFAELSSGIIAAHIRGEAISSRKLSRFSFKVAYYLILMFVPYAFNISFTSHNKPLAAAVFDWLHTFLVIQIVMENMVSVIENVAVISGKDKTAWISQIQGYVNNFFSNLFTRRS